MDISPWMLHASRENEWEEVCYTWATGENPAKQILLCKMQSAYGHLDFVEEEANLFKYTVLW